MVVFTFAALCQIGGAIILIGVLLANKSIGTNVRQCILLVRLKILNLHDLMYIDLYIYASSHYARFLPG